MRTTFSGHELPHVWASQSVTQNYGRASNFFFERETIYSYGRHFPIARFGNKKTVLLTTRSYSNSTARHVHRTKMAIPADINVIYVFDPSASDQTRNIELAIEDLKSIACKMISARESIVSLVHEFQTNRNNLRKLIEFAKLDKRKFPILRADLPKALELLKLEKLSSAVIGRIVEKYEKYRQRFAENQANREKQIAIDNEKLKPYLEQWKNGVSVKKSLYSLPVALRIVDSNIETSHGAIVSIADFQRAYKLLKAKKFADIGAIGNYQFQSANDEFAIVGCHTIAISEIERIANQLS